MLKDLCFEIISTCPNNCMFCSSVSSLSCHDVILFEDFKRVIDYFISEGGIEELSLSGGEPFLHPDLIKMVGYAKSMGIKTVIFTSGIKRRKPLSRLEKEKLLDEMNEKLQEVQKHEPFNEFLKNKIRDHYNNLLNPPLYSGLDYDELLELKEFGLDKIVFDYQASNEDLDSKIMGRPRYYHGFLLDSIIKASSIGLNIDIHFVPMKVNYEEISEIIEILTIGNIPRISLLRFVPQGRGRVNQEELELTSEELEAFLKVVEDKQKDSQCEIRVGKPLQKDGTHLCTAGLEKLNIKYDGTILPCPAFKELDAETMKKYGIKNYNIYTNLSDVKTPGGTRKSPLCDIVYRARKKE